MIAVLYSKDGKIPMEIVDIDDRGVLVGIGDLDRSNGRVLRLLAYGARIELVLQGTQCEQPRLVVVTRVAQLFRTSASSIRAFLAYVIPPASGSWVKNAVSSTWKCKDMGLFDGVSHVEAHMVTTGLRKVG